MTGNDAASPNGTLLHLLHPAPSIPTPPPEPAHAPLSAPSGEPVETASDNAVDQDADADADAVVVDADADATAAAAAAADAAGSSHVGIKGTSSIRDLQHVPSNNSGREEVARSRTPSRDAAAAVGEARRESNGHLRSTSLKIAKLRAAFEKHSHHAPVMEAGLRAPRPMSSGMQRDPSAERERDLRLEVARLKEEREKEVEMRMAYEEKCAMLEEEGEVLQERMEVLQERLEERDRAFEGREAACEERCQAYEEEVEVLQQKLAQQSSGAKRAHDVRIANLQQQLVDLKRSISASTRVDSQVSDSAFMQEMGVLHHELQNWIVHSYRRAKADVAPAELCLRLKWVADVGEKQSNGLYEICQRFDPASKLAFYQSLAVCVMMDIFNEPLLFGLTNEDGWREGIAKASAGLRKVLDVVAYRKWWASTVDAVRQCEKVQAGIDPAAKGIADKICKVLAVVTDVPTTEACLATLMGIVKRTIRLAHLFRVQRAVYLFGLPGAEPFRSDRMEDISMEDEVELDAPPMVKCSIFPYVTKFGDERGDNPHISTVIIKAKVLCSQPNP